MTKKKDDDNVIELKPTKPSTRARAKRGGPRSTTRFGNGAGYGGPAKGAGVGAENDPGKLVAGPHGPSEAGVARRAHQSEWAQKAKETLYDIMTGDKVFHATKIQAATALLNRLEGMPIARTLSAKADDPSQLSDEELLAELAKVGVPAPKPGETIQ